MVLVGAIFDQEKIKKKTQNSKNIKLKNHRKKNMSFFSEINEKTSKKYSPRRLQQLIFCSEMQLEIVQQLR